MAASVLEVDRGGGSGFGLACLLGQREGLVYRAGKGGACLAPASEQPREDGGSAPPRLAAAAGLGSARGSRGAPAAAPEAGEEPQKERSLSLVQSTQEIHFLDTTVLINDGHINTTLYRKPTGRYSYLHASSFHPDHTTRSIVYSQALRYNRICSNPSDRDKHLQDLYQAFLQLQYPPVEVKKQIDRARRVPRSHLLQDRPNKENNRTPLAVTFSPQLKPLQRIIKDLQPILKDDPTLSQILGDRPVLAYRQPPNLKQILTSNHIPHNRTTNPGTYPCNKARCQLCPHIYSGDIITGPNHISHTIRGSFTCTSTNVIYAIMCRQCPSAMYIGQTGQSLRKRINGHKSDVKNYNIHKPVGKHFNLSGHAITDMKVAILQQKDFKIRLQRETVELVFICKLDTINLGLNRDWEWLSHYAR
ncbi:uncharacterized protein LOC141975875 [Natator depressus]|uniref:uncharacterized protein LOC141975875 n=1 Tax=Natator depressus TaxID=27790 RepID=UPI003EBFFDE8